MRRYAEDVLELETEFRKYKVFRTTLDLVVVTNGVVASDAIKNSLLSVEEGGKKDREIICWEPIDPKRCEIPWQPEED